MEAEAVEAQAAVAAVPGGERRGGGGGGGRASMLPEDHSGKVPWFLDGVEEDGVDGEGQEEEQEEEIFVGESAEESAASAAVVAEDWASVTQGGANDGGGGFASILDQTPPPGIALPEPLHAAGRGAGVGVGRNERIPGVLAEALASLQTVVDHAAAAVGEVEVGAGVGEGGVEGRTGVAGGGVGEELGEEEQFGGREEQTILAAVAASRARSAAYGRGPLLAAKTRGGGGGGGVATAASAIAAGAAGAAAGAAAAARAAAIAAAAAASIDGGGYLSASSCVAWHPSTGRLVYTEGASLFAEELDSSRRCALLSDGGGGGFGCGGGGGGDLPRAAVAISAGGGLVARGTAGRTGPNARSGSLSIWSLGGDELDSGGGRNGGGGGGDGGDGGGGGSSREGGAGFGYPATSVVVDARDAESNDGVVALAFSPSGSELCSVGGWNGTRCLLTIRPTPSPSLSSPSSSPTRARGATGTAFARGEGVSAIVPAVTAAATSVVPLAAETRAICVLPPPLEEEGGGGGGGGTGADRPFLFVTAGEEGVALWLRACDGGGDSGGGGGGGGSGGDGQDGGVQLLGSSAGVRSTALASVGRFVVAAELWSAKGRGASVTAIDVDWLAAGGNEAAAAGAGAGARQHLVGGEECTWQAFGSSPGGGGDDVTITCLASAGPRRVAVAGRGGKLEVWDVEEACRGGGGGGGGERGGDGGGAFGPGERGAGLVHRLDLGVALDGVSVVDMTWESGGFDAVLGAGDKGMWHLRLPCGEEAVSHGDGVADMGVGIPWAGPGGVGGTPTLTRLWPGGKVKVSK